MPASSSPSAEAPSECGEHCPCLGQPCWLSLDHSYYARVSSPSPAKFGTETGNREPNRWLSVWPRLFVPSYPIARLFGRCSDIQLRRNGWTSGSTRGRRGRRRQKKDQGNQLTKKISNQNKIKRVILQHAVLVFFFFRSPFGWPVRLIRRIAISTL